MSLKRFSSTANPSKFMSVVLSFLVSIISLRNNDFQTFYENPRLNPDFIALKIPSITVLIRELNDKTNKLFVNDKTTYEGGTINCLIIISDFRLRNSSNLLHLK